VVVLVLGGGGTFAFVKSSQDKQSQKNRTEIKTTVEQYYNAIAAGNAAKALEALKNKPSSTALLTDKVLNSSDPITDVSVVVMSQSGSKAEVEVTYSINGTSTKLKHTLERTDGKDAARVWQIADRLAQVDVSAGAGSLPLLINEQPVPDPASVELFPGTYTLTADTEYVTLSNNTFTVTDRSMTKTDAVTATLTDDGADAFRAAVVESIIDCLDAWTISCDCGESVDRVLGGGTEVTEGSVARVLTTEAENWLETFEPRLDTADPARITAPSHGSDVGFVVAAKGTTPEGKAVEGVIGPGNSDEPRIFLLGSPRAVIDSSGELDVTWPLS